jgi:hypothetical protein
MNCNVCLTPIPDPLLSCPVCAEKKSRASLLEQQKFWLPAMVRGDEKIVLTRKSDRGPAWHIRMAGTNTRAFCGEPLSPGWRQLRRDFGELRFLQVCAPCYDMLQRLAKEVA